MFLFFMLDSDITDGWRFALFLIFVYYSPDARDSICNKKHDIKISKNREKF